MTLLDLHIICLEKLEVPLTVICFQNTFFNVAWDILEKKLFSV